MSNLPNKIRVVLGGGPEGVGGEWHDLYLRNEQFEGACYGTARKLGTEKQILVYIPNAELG